MVTIKREGEIEITLPDEDAEAVKEKAATPPTMEMLKAQLDQIMSLVRENSDAIKAMKPPPKPPKEDDEDEETQKADETTSEPKEDVVEKHEGNDIMAFITKVVDEKVAEKLGEQPIQKRSTAPAEPQTFDTPMDIPPEVFARADPESILKMGGFTTRRNR